MGFWGKTVFFRSFPLISAHFRSFPFISVVVGAGAGGQKPVSPLISLIPVHSCSFQSWWALVGKKPVSPLISGLILAVVGAGAGGRKTVFSRSFPFGSVRMDQSVWLTHMCSIALKSMLAGVSGIGKGRGSAGRWQSYCQEDDLTNIDAQDGQDWNFPQRR